MNTIINLPKTHFTNKMATRLRLQRHGHKHYAFYSIVAADARAPRDGRFIEKLGTYNPNTAPSTVDLNFDRALYWLQVGAQPTDTVRAILSREGVMLMKHLLGGVKKGAFTEEEAKAKFEAWKADKERKLQAVRDGESKASIAAKAARLEEEKAYNAKVAEKVAEKRAAAAKAEAEAEAAPEAAEEAEAPAEA